MVVLIGPQGEVPVQRLHVRLQRLPEQDRDVRIRHQKTDPSGLSERVRQHRPGDHRRAPVLRVPQVRLMRCHETHPLQQHHNEGRDDPGPVTHEGLRAGHQIVLSKGHHGDERVVLKHRLRPGRPLQGGQVKRGEEPELHRLHERVVRQSPFNEALQAGPTEGDGGSADGHRLLLHAALKVQAKRQDPRDGLQADTCLHNWTDQQQDLHLVQPVHIHLLHLCHEGHQQNPQRGPAEEV